MDKVDGVSLLNAPPLSVLLDQQLIENESKTADGEKKKISYIEQQFFAIGCAANPENLTLYPIDISVHLDTPVAAPGRVHSSLASLKPLPPDDELALSGSKAGNSAKRRKIMPDENGSSASYPKLQELCEEVERFALLLSNEIDDE